MNAPAEHEHGGHEHGGHEHGGVPDDSGDDFVSVARRADRLREEVAHYRDPNARELLDETVEAIMAFNRHGLVELVRMLRSDPRGADLLYRAVEKPEVMALLASHDIVRADRTLDVLRVVEQLKPYLVASSVDLEVVEVDGDVAHVRFSGSGCGGVDTELKDSVSSTLVSRVPGLRAVQEVEAEPNRAFVPLQSIRVGAPS
jgi:Fe-S cluster biogenesis protein NfuA